MARTKTNIYKKHFSYLFILIYILYVLEWFLQEMLSIRLGTVNDFHWVFKPVLS